MLKKEDFVHYGKFLKPHGTKGEIGLQGEDFALGEGCDFVAVEIDGILVPFFFEYCRTKNNDATILKIERMNSSEEVRFLTNRDVYIPREWVEDEENLSWSYFKGFLTSDKQLGRLGEIIDVDDSTINTLFIIDRNGEEILVPAREEFIAGIDHKKKTITFDLPDGLVAI